MHRAELSEGVCVSYFEVRLLALEFQILGIETDAGVRKDAIRISHLRGPDNLRARAHLGSITDLDPWSDDGVRSHPDALAELGSRIDNRGRMNIFFHRNLLSRLR
jgi:hypothetical protein